MIDSFPVELLLDSLAEGQGRDEVEQPRTNEEQDRDNDDPRRRFYQLTDLGVEVVQAERERLKNLVAESRKLGFV